MNSVAALMTSQAGRADYAATVARLKHVLRQQYVERAFF
jgi:hypothetical protein